MRTFFCLALVFAACGDATPLPSDAGADASGPPRDLAPTPPDCGLCGHVHDLAIPSSTGISCTQSGAAQCSCYQYGAGNSTACNDSLFTTGLCCATASWPGATQACFCETFGCSQADTSNGASCVCVIGLTGPSACTPSSGALCCASDNQPSCTCTPGLASCPSGSTAVSRCDLSTTSCGAGYTYPRTVSSCR